MTTSQRLNVDEFGITQIELGMRALNERVNRAVSSVSALGAMLAAIQCQRGMEWMFMLKNKFGLTKDQAQKMFYDYKNKGQEQDPDQQGGDPKGDPKEAASGTVEQKISLIMGYMKETSTKIDQIERDITYLKEQVDKILQKI